MKEQDRIPSHPPTPQGMAHEEPQRVILMTPHMAAIGGLLAFFTVVAMVVILPTATYQVGPSQNWLPLSNLAWGGRAIFLSNGCEYCHSGFTRPQDTYYGLYYLYPRVAEPGDYYGSEQSPNTLGTERTGPDLSQEGGNHPDSWHVAHYWNARSVNPFSIMPRFNFLTDQQLAMEIAYNQASGGKEAALRYAAQTVAQDLQMISAGEDNSDPAQYFPAYVQQLKQKGTYKPDGTPDDTDPSGLSWGDVFDTNTFERSYWLTQDPLPVTQDNLNRGRVVFEQRCVGCHGPKGLGNGPARDFLNPTPDDFSDPGMFSSPTDSDGERYHRILTGGRGTAMENFGTRLSVQDIWRVVLFLRTIPNSGFQEPVTTVDRYQGWQAPPELIAYIKTHPIEDPSLSPAPPTDPFMGGAKWILGGMSPKDTILVGGKMPVTLADVAGLIRARYLEMVNVDIKDAQGRSEQLPAIQQLLSTDGIVWHDP